MACLNMFNNDQQQHQAALYNPRISFSNDFGDTHQQQQQMSKLDHYREAPVSSDFAFSVPTYSMISADEVFFKGKMLPLRENNCTNRTLKDELLAGEDEDDDVAGRFGKGLNSWKEKLGLKRPSLVVTNKKCDVKTSGGDQDMKGQI